MESLNKIGCDMIKNTKNSFGIISRLFHWFMSLGIISLLIVGFLMINMSAPGKYVFYGPHKASGVIMLGLVILRLVWRLTNITPTLPNTMPNWQRNGYKLGVFFMYIFMFAMPISGVLMSLNYGMDINVFNLFTIKSAGKNIDLARFASDIHFYTSIAFVAIIAGHISISLYHHFIDKDRLLIRMIKGK